MFNKFLKKLNNYCYFYPHSFVIMLFLSYVSEANYVVFILFYSIISFNTDTEPQIYVYFIFKAKCEWSEG